MIPVKATLIALLTLLLSNAPLVNANANAHEGHEGHDHSQIPINMKTATELALKTTQDYTKSPSGFNIGQLPPSWENLPLSATSIYENKLGYYVVAVENIADKKTLYLRILLNGTVEGANFTGKFSPIEKLSPPNTDHSKHQH